MTSNTVFAELKNGVLRLTMNRPEKRNALNSETVAAFHEALERSEMDADVHAVAIFGAGKDFCAGADLAELLDSVDRSRYCNRSRLKISKIWFVPNYSWHYRENRAICPVAHHQEKVTKQTRENIWR